jgi:hypothetical protein
MIKTLPGTGQGSPEVHPLRPEGCHAAGSIAIEVGPVEVGIALEKRLAERDAAFEAVPSNHAAPSKYAASKLSPAAKRARGNFPRPKCACGLPLCARTAEGTRVALTAAAGTLMPDDASPAESSSPVPAAWITRYERMGCEPASARALAGPLAIVSHREWPSLSSRSATNGRPAGTDCPEPCRLDLIAPALIGRGRSSWPVRRQSGLSSGSSGGKRRPEPRRCHPPPRLVSGGR